MFALEGWHYHVFSMFVFRCIILLFRIFYVVPRICLLLFIVDFDIEQKRIDKIIKVSLLRS